MSVELQARAAAFLRRAIPDGIDFVPGSVAEMFIATYAKRGSLPDDPEADELLSLACVESQSMADQLTGQAAEYFQESSAILEGIQGERE
jgi:hypothetical protein